MSFTEFEDFTSPIALDAIEIAVWTDMYAAPDNNFAASLGISHHMIGRASAYVASKIDMLALNRVMGSGSAASISASELRQIVDLYRGSGVSRFFVTHTEMQHGSSRDVLLSAGLTHYNNWVKLYRDISPVEGVESGLIVKRIGRDLAPQFARIIVEAFEWPVALENWMSTTVERPNWYHYLAFDGNHPVAAASMFIHKRMAWMGFAATLTEHRGKGAQGLLTLSRIADAAAYGAKVIVVETAEETPNHPSPSFRNMVRYGFKVAYNRPNFIHQG